MKLPLSLSLSLAVCAGSLCSSKAAPEAVPIFDGKTLKGWESKSPERWRVENGAITSGDLKEKIPKNFFLFTEKEYADFEFRCQFRLTGDPKTGLINSGIQFRSKHMPNGYASGYQADIGDPEWWGCIYDEHRRNRVIAKSDIAKVGPAVKRNDWNEYVIRCEGPRSRLWINGVLTVDYVEKDPKIARSGKIAVQVHSGGAAKVEFKDMTIQEFERKESPLTPAEQLGTFRIPEGFEVELVASEETGLPKPITVSFDDSGRMWSITATEYPVDANETPDVAMALWKNGGKDRVLVFDNPLVEGPHSPRAFAEGLAMPMGVLPWKDGAIVGHGPEILFLGDSDGDGKADSREVLVKGFGVQDSHLLPHQFTMMPGGWIAMAQGAFNRSKVVAGENAPVSFDYCKMGRFRPDGSLFETIGYGLNNIWGLVLNREGEVFIQEANDMNYSVAPFQVGSSYPGIGSQKFKPYAPFAPPIANFRLGGTGLSGLALSEERSGGFPAPWDNVMFVANPITGTINAVRVHDTEGGGFKAERLPDFLSSGDEWFRPIAITFGPDGCLYIVDWYNKIISHNEVPRKHPDRDKTRGRVFRVRHVSQTNRSVPDIAGMPDAELVKQLKSDSTWAMRAAWRQIVFREAKGLAPQLAALAEDEGAPADARIHALWALRDLGLADRELAVALTKSSNRNIRREAAAVVPGAVRPDEIDPQVRAQAIRTLSREFTPANIAGLIAYAEPMLQVDPGAGEVPWGGRHGKPLPPGSVYDRAFERYLVRAALERAPDKVAAFLDSPEASKLPAENRLFASLALPPALATASFVRAWADIDRAPDDEELLLLLKGSADPKLAPVVSGLFADAKKAPNLMRAVLRLRDRIDAGQVKALLEPALAKLAAQGGSEDLVVEIASAFRLAALKDELVSIAKSDSAAAGVRAGAVEALGRIGAGADPAVLAIASADSTPQALRIAALGAAGSGGDKAAGEKVIAIAATLAPPAREDLMDRLAGSANGVDVILAGIAAEKIDPGKLTPAILERMRALRPDSPSMKVLWAEMSERFPRALRLSGKADQFARTGITLAGPFTVETWVRLDPNIHNDDGILGRPGGADFNFFNGIFRVYGGPRVGDVAVASRPMAPSAWTHLGVTRDERGEFKIYINGELDATGTKRLGAPFEGLNVGHTTPADAGTAGEIMEFRVWNSARTPEQIRANFNRSFEGSSKRPAGLVHYFPFGGDSKALSGGAKISALAESPSLLNDAQAAAEEERLAKFRAIAGRPGADPKRGEPLFKALCMTCHTVGGEGAGAGPPLDGSGHRDLDSLLRAVLTPNAAVEPGYRAYRVETHDGRLAEGFLVKHDENGATLRLMGGSDLQFPQKEIRRARYLNRSFMVPGLFDALGEQQVADVIAYIGTLKEDAVAPTPGVKTGAKPAAAEFGRQVSASGIKHSFLIAGTPTVLVGEDGKVKWKTAGRARDAFVLENGNVLASIDNKAQEITPEGQVVWSYQLGGGNKELGTAVRLENGNTLVVERGVKPRLLEVSPKGEIAVEVPLKPETDNAHMQTRMARKLPNGNYLVPHLLAFKVNEYQADGTIVRTIKTDLKELGGREARNWPFTAIRLENGNTLVNLTNGNKTVEFGPDGKVVWKVTNEDVGGRFADPCGGQRLANGNTIICSYGQRDAKKPKLFEVTRDKKVVWEFFHPQVRAHEVHVLTTNGKPEGALK